MKFNLFLALLCLVGMVCCLIQIVTQNFDVLAHILFLSLGLMGTFALRSISKHEKY
jgi:predicted membrane channel-forming protein YqfA (hemolysin III family)